MHAVSFQLPFVGGEAAVSMQTQLQLDHGCNEAEYTTPLTSYHLCLEVQKTMHTVAHSTMEAI